MAEKSEKIILFNVGVKFGLLTKGTMTALYQAETFKPFTNENVQDLVDGGAIFEIRPATPQEMNWTYKELGKYHYNNTNI